VVSWGQCEQHWPCHVRRGSRRCPLVELDAVIVRDGALPPSMNPLWADDCAEVEGMAAVTQCRPWL
jgi:hypothetical protein